MARPRKSTLDALLDTFSEWNAEDRAFSLGQLQAIHRALCVAERKTPTTATPINAALAMDEDPIQ